MNKTILNISFLNLNGDLITELKDLNFNPFKLGEEITLLVKPVDENSFTVRQESNIKEQIQFSNEHIEMYHNKKAWLYSMAKFLEYDVLGNTILDIHYTCMIKG
jgi:hypothetical protein